jgi:hypothetical protein
MISKVYFKILVLLELAQSLEISDLAMAKVEKINIAVSYLSMSMIKHFQYTWACQFVRVYR